MFSQLASKVRASDDDWTDDLKDKTSGEIPDKSREDANKALEDASKSPQTICQMTEEIKALVKDGNDLDSRLLGVQYLIEKAKLPSAGQAKDLREAYVGLLWKSRDIAGSAKGAADDFRGDMIDMILMDELSADEKIAELGNWNRLTQKKGKAAKEQPGKFEEFEEKVTDYANIVELEISNKDTEAKAKMEQLSADVLGIAKQIDVLTVNIVDPIVKYLKLAGGTFAALLSGSPETAFSALLSAVKQGIPELQQFDAHLRKTQDERQELEAKRERIKVEMRELEGEQLRLGDASAVPSSLRSIAEGIKDFASRMTTFTDSFTQLENEQADIQNFLKEGTPTSDPVFSTSLDLLRELLSINSGILDIYAKASLSNP